MRKEKEGKRELYMKENTKIRFIFAMYIAVSLFGAYSAIVFSTTIPHCLLLSLCSLFALVCGIVIIRGDNNEQKSIE